MGGGKTTNATAATVDLTQSIASIMQASNELYPALTTAGVTATTQLNNAANQSAGYNNVANRAITFQQQLLGITPVNLEQKQSMAAFNSLQSQVMQTFSSLQQYSGDNGQVGTPASQPTSTNKPRGYAGSQKQEVPPPASTTGFSSAGNSAAYYQGQMTQANTLMNSAYDPNLTVQQRQDAANQAQSIMTNLYNTATATGMQDGKPLLAQPAMQALGASIQSFNNNFKSNYDPNIPQAFSASQVSQMVQDNPEYQASYDSGIKALQRTAAAGGMLSSGNTLKAASDFGTQLAGTVYKDLLNNVSSLTGQASGVAAQSAQQISQNAMGTYQMNTAPQQYRSSALMQIGQNQNQAAETNAQLQTQVSMANAAAANANSQASSGGAGQLVGAVGGRLLGAFGL